MIAAVTRHRRYYRLRTPTTNGSQPVACSVSVDADTGQLYLAVGSGRRRMYLTPDEAWTLWRCLTEAVTSLGDPPQHVRANIRPSSGRRAA